MTQDAQWGWIFKDIKVSLSKVKCLSASIDGRGGRDKEPE